jgi:uncharacterized membrane protein
MTPKLSRRAITVIAVIAVVAIVDVIVFTLTFGPLHAWISSLCLYSPRTSWRWPLIPDAFVVLVELTILARFVLIRRDHR